MSVDFADTLEHFGRCRILCIGDVMLDKFIYGKIERISPEAPIPVFAIKEERTMLGGAGNVARNLISFGAQTAFISVIGNDKVGREITSMIGKEPLITPYLLTEPGRISTTKTRYVAGTQQVLRADHEVQSSVNAETVRMILDAVATEISEYDVIVLSDYGKGIFSRDTVQAIIALAKEHGKPVIIDPKSRDFDLYHGATCVSPNLNELANASARELRTEEDIIESAKNLIKLHDIKHLLVTRSRDGMLLVQSGWLC